MSESISQLPLATQANATDLIPATQGSIGPGTGTTRAVTPTQIMAAPITGTLTFAHPTVTDGVAKATGYEIEQDITYNISATATGIFFGNVSNCVVNGNPQATQVWNNLDRGFQETASTAFNDLVIRYMQAVRPATFGAPLSVMQGAVIDMVDQTGLPTSGAGGLLGLEIDLECNDVDDGSVQRQAIVVQLKAAPGVTAPEPSATSAFGVFANSGAYFKTIITFGAPFHDAAIDCRFAGLAAGGTNNALWLRTSQSVAFDTGGLFRLSTDEATLNSSQKFRSDNGFQIGGTDIISADGSTVTTNVPYRAPNHTIAALPVLAGGELGAISYASDALRLDGGAGGIPVFLNSAGQWITAWGTTPSASNQSFVVAGAATFQSTATVTGTTSVSITGYELYSGGTQALVATTRSVSLSCPNGAVLAVTVDANSDKRIKSDIQEITPADGEAFVMSAKPSTYMLNGHKQSGFIAQDMIRAGYYHLVGAAPQEGLPELVEDGLVSKQDVLLTLSYNDTIAYLAAALKGALSRIKTLEAKE